jgi:C-terminal peptidase prc
MGLPSPAVRMIRIVCLLLLCVLSGGCARPGRAADAGIHASAGVTPAAPLSVVTSVPAPPTPSSTLILPIPSTAATIPISPASTATLDAPAASTIAVEATTSATSGVIVQPSPTLPVLDEAVRAKRFDEVWQTINDHYLYRDFRGVNWAAVKQQYRPEALRASTAETFYETIGKMVDSLNDHHSRYISPQQAVDEQALATGTDTYVGIGVALAGDGTAVLIDTVFPDSPAERSGLRRRDRLVLIDGMDPRAAEAALRGPEGSTVALRVQAPGEAPRDVVVERRAVTARLLPEAYRLGSTNVGYLLIQSFWAEDMGKQTELRLQQLLAAGPLSGLIVDVRGNQGGWRPVLEELLGNFTEGRVGEFFGAAPSYALDIKPNELRPRLRGTSVIVLVDQKTQSYAEIFAAALQELTHAKVVGGRTAGNTETVFPYDFEDKSRLWIAQEGFRLPSGANLEGRGVVPDAVVEADWASFSEATDPYMLRALDLLAEGQKVAR